MLQVTPQALAEVKVAYQRYCQLVEAKTLTPKTKKTYLYHPGKFVEWLGGEYTPGVRAS